MCWKSLKECGLQTSKGRQKSAGTCIVLDAKVPGTLVCQRRLYKILSSGHISDESMFRAFCSWPLPVK